MVCRIIGSYTKIPLSLTIAISPTCQLITDRSHNIASLLAAGSMHAGFLHGRSKGTQNTSPSRPLKAHHIVCRVAVIRGRSSGRHAGHILIASSGRGVGCSWSQEGVPDVAQPVLLAAAPLPFPAFSLPLLPLSPLLCLPLLPLPGRCACLAVRQHALIVPGPTALQVLHPGFMDSLHHATAMSGWLTPNFCI